MSVGGGSSPLTRGKRLFSNLFRLNRRLIPAHAGKTVTRPPRFSNTTAHPRSRGENTGSPRGTRLKRGSSPLTRGKHPGHNHARRALRAHPRSRGENVRPLALTVPMVGSSPLTRGKLLTIGCLVGVLGLIPAHAGKTTRSGARTFRCEAHPRSRGENSGEARPAKTELGSSPLTRGKQALRLALSGDRGLIPAHAGKTGDDGARVRQRRAHPRSRGENPVPLPERMMRCGSSPLTRGKQRTPA